MHCPNCQTNNPAHAKFCLECGNRLIICPSCSTVNLPVAKFCMECGTALVVGEGVARSVLPSSTADVYATQPMPEVLLPPAERRVVTVMFADITGSTPLADRLDPEDIRAILTGYFNLMTEQIRKHGGTVEKYIGDAVMAIFGAPVAHEDDPDRALRAALDMQVALAQFNKQRQAQDPTATRLQMRIGINTGEVALPSNVSHPRQDFLITGDAVNIAARLQQCATPDTILVGERTYLSTRDVFDFRTIAPLSLKGKPEPIPAHVVLGLRKQVPTIAQHPRGIEGRQAPLIGRTLELTLLHANYARVQAERRPSLITILGAPGIGKSRLVHEFITRELEAIQDTTSIVPKVLKGRCPPYGEGITYWPLVEILRSLLGVHEGESDQDVQVRFLEFVRTTLLQAQRPESPEEIAQTIFRRIGPGLGEKISDTASLNGLKREPQVRTHATGTKQNNTQGMLRRAWRVLLEALAKQQPLILIVDDLQWADEALLDLLEYLTERIVNSPLLFLCPARLDFLDRKRDWGGGKRNFMTIELDALSRDESSNLIDALLNATDLPDTLRSTILARAEGNPFFVEEIVRMFIDQGILVNEEDQESREERWHLGTYANTLNELLIPTEYPDDSLVRKYYLLPLPRIPDTIQGVLAARVDLLNPTEKLLLQHAAIIGRTFWLSSLVELTPELDQETILEALVSLSQRDFIIETEGHGLSPAEEDRAFTFKHVLIHDVVYNNIPRSRRTQDHAHLACWLEKQTASRQEGFIEQLAYHFQQALAAWSEGSSLHMLVLKYHADTREETICLTRSELRSRVVHYLTLAGDQALHNYYTVRAIQAYDDAFDLLVASDATAPRLSKMLIKLGDAYAQRGMQDEAWQQYRRALQLAQKTQNSHEHVAVLELYERLALLGTRWLSGFNQLPEQQEIRGYIDAGLQLLANTPTSREHVAFLTYLAFWYIQQLETADSLQKMEIVEKALAYAQEAQGQAEQLNDPRSLSLVLDALSYIYSQCHKYNESHRLQHRRQGLESALTEREELYDLYISLGKIHEQIADYASALMWFGRAWNNAQTMESPVLLLESLTGRMRTWRQWNRWMDAQEVAHEILQLVERYQQDEKRQLWALETLATIAYRTGDQEAGDRYSHRYKRLIDQHPRHPEQEETTQLHAASMHAIYLAREDWELATAAYREKLTSSEPIPSPEVVSVLAELLVTTEARSEEQAEMCERAITLAEQSGARKSLMIALRARGRMYIARGDWQRARDDLLQALQYCESLDLPWERGATLYHIGMYYRLHAAAFDPDAGRSYKADISRARYHFEQALGFFEAQKALPFTKRVKLLIGQEVSHV